MPKANEEDQVVIRTDSESENETEPSSEPPPKKLQTASTSSSSMPSRKASSRKASKERETKTAQQTDGSTAKEVLTPAGLQQLLNKITGGSGHHDSLIAIDRLTINEILILKRRIAHYDLEGSKDLLGREIDHIHNRADMFSDGSDTTDTESPSNEVGLKLLYEEMKELKSSTKINKNRKIRQSSTGFC